MVNRNSIYTIGFSMLFAMACSTPSTDEPKEAITPTEVVTSAAKHQLAPNTVCMVNNAYMGGKEQIPVSYDGKTYYGCCNMCIKRIKTDRSVRYALDPFSGQEVDKALAFIVPSRDGSQVQYFASEANFRAFQKQ
jgi:YHS domain-containing protein